MKGRDKLFYGKEEPPQACGTHIEPTQDCDCQSLCNGHQTEKSSHKHEHDKPHGNHAHGEHDCHSVKGKDNQAFCDLKSECGCGHCAEEESHHHHGHGGKSDIIRLAAGAVVFAVGLFGGDFLIAGLPYGGFLKTALLITAYVILGYDVLLNAFKNILKGKVFDENFLMGLATVGAIAIGEYPEAVAVMLFYQIGELFSDLAVSKSEKSINEIMDIRPDYAFISQNGERIRVKAATVGTGEIIVVSPGERIPLDGVVTEGNTYLDTSSLTGESVPRKAGVGDTVLGGAVNNTGVIYVRTTSEYGNSAAARIIEAMRNSLDKKAQPERFITVFAKRYTPIVVFLAVILAFVPPIFDGYDFAKWVYRALIFLVVSCPCALVISVPLGFFAGLGASSKKGIIIKGGSVIEALSKANTAVFDKTGTLTEGVFEVGEIRCEGSKAEFLKFAAYAEFYSNHPIAEAIKSAYTEKIDESQITEYKEIAGKGISVQIFGKSVLAGNAKLLLEQDIAVPEISSIGTVVYLTAENQYLGYLTVSDKIRDTQALRSIKALGLKTVMLTGDRAQAAKKVADIVGIDEVYSELLPQDKVSIMERLSQNRSCIFTGDGINDAPVLAVSDVGIAMGGIGADAAIEAADAVLMNDDLSKIPEAIRISKKTMGIVKQNIGFSIGIKVLIMVLSIFGIASMWLAVFADVGVTFLAVLNAVRILRRTGGKERA